MTRIAISSDQAPAAIGPYTPAIAHAGLLWCSGQLGLNPSDGNMVAGGVEAQTQQALANLQALCRAAGTSLSQALRCTIYCTDLGDFAAINACYAAVVGNPAPARACVQVAALPKGALVEIDAVVALDHMPAK